MMERLRLTPEDERLLDEVWDDLPTEKTLTEKFNPNHDARGRFAHGQGFGGGTLVHPTAAAVAGGVAYTDQANAKAAERWLTKQYPDTQFKLTGMDKICANEVARTWTELAERYPQVAHEVKAVTTRRGMDAPGTQAYAQTWGITPEERNKPIQIDLNQTYFKDGVAFALRKQRDVESGWLAPGTASIGATLTHEFGHAVDGYLLRNPATAQQWYDWKMSGKLSSTMEPSMYARFSVWENIAESFAYQHHYTGADKAMRYKGPAMLQQELDKLLPNPAHKSLTEKFNPNHDARGRFAHGSGFAGGDLVHPTAAAVRAPKGGPYVDQPNQHAAALAVEREFRSTGLRVNLDKADLEAANAIARELVEMGHTFPEAMANVRSVKVTELANRNYYAEVLPRRPDGRHDIQFEPDWWSDSTRLKGQLQQDVQTMWHPSGCDAMGSIVTHEFGHVVYDTIAQKDEVFKSDWASKWNARDLNVSGYARTSASEAWAEEFAALRWGGADRLGDEAAAAMRSHGMREPLYVTKAAYGAVRYVRGVPVLKFNPNHDARGRFAHGPGGLLAPSTFNRAGGMPPVKPIEVGDIARGEAAARKHLTDGLGISASTKDDDLVYALTGESIRSGVKADIVNNIADRMDRDGRFTAAYKDAYGAAPSQVDRRMFVDDVVGNWASTAADSDPRAHVMQRAIADELGVGGVDQLQHAWSSTSGPTLRNMADELYASKGGMYRAVARAMYDETQEKLKAEGITFVSLNRGLHYDEGSHKPDWVDKVDAAHDGIANVRVRGNPVSSWSGNFSIAQEFMQGGERGISHPYVLEAYVPRERIFSTARTGLGCLPEQEFLVLDGPGKVRVQLMNDMVGYSLTEKFNPNHDARGRFARGPGFGGGNLLNPTARAEAAPAFRSFKSGGEANKWGEEHYAEWARGLSVAERDALEGYRSQWYDFINKSLRQPDQPLSPAMQEKVAARIPPLDSALAKAVVPEGVTVWRGMVLDRPADIERLVGRTYTDRGYVSTSTKQNDADAFAGVGQQRLMLEIHVPAGAHGAYLNALGDLTGEHELLLPRDTKFKVVSAKQSHETVRYEGIDMPGISHAVLEVLP